MSVTTGGTVTGFESFLHPPLQTIRSAREDAMIAATRNFVPETSRYRGARMIPRGGSPIDGFSLFGCWMTRCKEDYLTMSIFFTSEKSPATSR